MAIDGPAASGKSSTARWVAQRVGFRHVDSGSLYRAVTCAALDTGLPAEQWDESFILEASHDIRLVPADSAFVPVRGGVHMDDAIRGAGVTQHVSRVARMPAVRVWVNAQIRSAAQSESVVVDGRDIGTAVFPDAAVKIFLVADPWERARRRLREGVGRAPRDEEIAQETDRLVQRDARDAMQSTQAKDAILIDTTYLTQEEQVDRIVALVRVVSAQDRDTSGH